VRREHALFSTLDNLLGRFAVRLAKVSAWMTSRTEVFTAGNYGHSRTEVETLLEAHTAFEQQAVQYTAAIDALEVWANTPGMEKHEEQANCLAHVVHARAALGEVLAAGAAYHATLLLMKEKYENLQTCSKLEVWLEQQTALFASGNHGESLVAAEDLLKAYQETFIDALPKWKQSIVFKSQQQEVLDRVAALNATMTQVEAQGEQYKAALEVWCHCVAQCCFLRTRVG
jgi:hypothetical protein